MISALSEQLSKQSLEDVNHPLNTAPYQTRSKTRAQLQSSDQHGTFTEHITSFEAPSVTVNEDLSFGERPRSKSHTAGSLLAPQDVTGEDSGEPPCPALAPPKKRHCRSMSVGELSEAKQRARARWKPRATKLWRPAGTEAYQPGHSPLSKTACFNYHRLSSNIPSNAGASTLNISTDISSTPPESPVPRPISAPFWDGATNPPFWLERFNFRPVISPRTVHNFAKFDERDRMSESSGSVTSVSSSRSDSLHEMELRNQKVVQRCKSQPSVPVSRRGSKKRRRDGSTRPKLDFYKMEEARLHKHEDAERGSDKSDIIWARVTRSQAVMCGGKRSSLRSAGRKPSDDFLGLQPIASSPGESSGGQGAGMRPISPETGSNASSSVMVTPTGSPAQDLKGDAASASSSRHRNISKDDGYHGDSDIDEEEEEMFPCNDLDLEAIENH